jgi:hypothetical protein
MAPLPSQNDLQTVVTALQQMTVQLGNLIKQISISAPPANTAGLVNAANDAAAATAGVPLFGMYRNGSVMMIRVV